MKHRKVPKAMGRPVNNGRSSATEFTVVSLTCSLTYFHLINVLKTKARLFDSNPPNGNDNQKVVTRGLRNNETNEACFF